MQGLEENGRENNTAASAAGEASSARTGETGIVPLYNHSTHGAVTPPGEIRMGRPPVIKGAALMGLAMLISKTIGTLQKIPLQNVAGDRVFGIYNAVYPLYQLLLVMVTAGFPVAVSLMVAERESVGDRHGSRQVLKASVLLLGVSGTAGFALMWLGADRVALWIGDTSTAPAVRTAALALWLAPVMSGLRGYYQGIGRMLPSAVSQLSEQSVRVAAMLAMLAIGWHLGWADDSLAAGATAGSAFGAAAGLAVITAYWLRDRGHGGRGGVTNLSAGDTGDPARVGEGSGVRQVWVLEGKTLVEMPAGAAEAYRDGGGDFGRRDSSREAVAGDALRSGHLVDVHAGGQLRGGLLQVVRRLAALAVPVTLGALAVPALSVVDAFTVPRLLRETGADGAGAMALFGLYSRGQPLVQLVVMVASAVAAALVPALAAARVRGNLAETKQHAAFVMRAAWAIGAAAAAGLALLAEPVNVMLYADNAGTLTFALVACTALAGTVNAVAAAVLQGLGSVRAPALFMLAAASLKAVLNAALVPAFGIAGAAWAGIAALVAAALLSAGAVRRATGAAMPARSAAGIGLALAVMAAALVLAEHGGAALLGPLPPRAAAAALALGGTALGGALFAAALLRCGGISERELRGLPGGAAIAERLRRWRLLPRSD